MLINKYKKKKDIKSNKASLKKKNLELRKKLKMIKMKLMRLIDTMKDIYAIIISFQERLLHAQRFLRSTKLKKIDEKILRQIKSFFKKYTKVIYDMFKSINEAYNFFEQRYLTLARKMFFYINDNLFTREFIN